MKKKQPLRRLADISPDEYIQMMQDYAKQFNTVRKARKYLRSLGLVLNSNGEIIGLNNNEE